MAGVLLLRRTRKPKAMASYLRAVCSCLCPLCRGDPCDRPWGKRASGHEFPLPSQERDSLGAARVSKRLALRSLTVAARILTFPHKSASSRSVIFEPVPLQETAQG